ncbi:zf-HC2 domain-containing protein [Saccharopolyspora sp. NFXS83]|uniref:zf-HC2 domain-containing protein n=1 Tax=Saccharopolyspora sp. NFXS83 TaxID=2993560 RepID=UPI00224ABC87|nr:zf-HC2 domain-containing protein [Saccharopolyspora sp. NFXS83]MCX2732415.1 zf-HC2 domain-containing protein [Saccharopolyspora sp. NFXS83]
MNCESCRNSVSAMLDGEPPEFPEAEVDAHLETCAACRAFQAEAGELTRHLRVRLVAPTPDLAGAVLARVPRRDRVRGVLRGALAVAATAQILLALAQMVGVVGLHGHAGHSGMTEHLFNESTAWNLALGVGMLWASWRDRTAGGVLPVLSAFVAALAGFSVHDLIVGAATVERVASHALLLVGLGLLFAVHRRGGGGPAPADAGHDGGSGTAGDGSAPELAPDQAPPHLRPTAYRRAA